MTKLFLESWSLRERPVFVGARVLVLFISRFDGSPVINVSRKHRTIWREQRHSFRAKLLTYKAVYTGLDPVSICNTEI